MSKTAPALDWGCDTSDMILVHRVYRREFRLLPRMIRAVSPGDRDRSRLVAAHTTEMLESLHHHHTGEDELLWPKLNARIELEHELVDRMEDQHARVGELIATITNTLPGWAEAPDRATGDRLAELVDTMADGLEEHLDDEEQLVLPLVATHISVAEWNELAERGMAAMPKSRLLVFLGYLLEDASPAERARFFGRVRDLLVPRTVLSADASTASRAHGCVGQPD